jgi:hypothetical protein
MIPVILATTAIGLAGCAQPPSAEIDAASAAVQGAMSAGGSEYAASAMQAAQDAQAQLQAELKAQEGRFALMRSYGEAAKLAAAAQQAGEAAQAAAKAGKEEARTQAAAAVESARAELQAATDLLASAPRGKGTAQDIEAMKMDLAGVQTSLDEAAAAMQAEKYKDAIAKAEAGRAGAAAVKGAVEQAMAARGGRR